jgi:hypothetical protein
MAATHKLVQQAMTGQWQDVPKTIEERRMMLDQLSASATAQDQQWLGALKQAMAESDAAVAQMSQADGSRESGTGNQEAASSRGAGEGIPNAQSREVMPNTAAPSADSAIDSMIDMIRGSR